MTFIEVRFVSEGDVLEIFPVHEDTLQFGSNSLVMRSSPFTR